MPLSDPNDILNNNRDEDSDNGSVEDVDPASKLGGRRKKGSQGLIPSDKTDGLVKEAGKEGAEQAVKKKDKEPSLKITIKLDLNVKINLDAHIDGWIEIGLL